MTLSRHDTAIVEHLNDFKQSTTSQIARLFFAEARSRNTYDKVLGRLKERGYIRPMRHRRLVKEDVGGSGPTIWRLGRVGWEMCEHRDRYRTDVAESEHTLDIVDAYVQLIEAGPRFVVQRYITEPDCWFTSNDASEDIYLEPDLQLEVLVDGRFQTWWLEVARSGQHLERQKEKISRYVAVYERGFTPEEDRCFSGVFPRVVFVLGDKRTQESLARYIATDERYSRMFAAVTSADFPSGL